MDLSGHGFEVGINFAEQSDEWLIDAATEIYDAATARGLEIPLFTGGLMLADVQDGESESQDSSADIKKSLIESIPLAVEGYHSIIGAIDLISPDKYPQLSRRETAKSFADRLNMWLTQDKIDLLMKIKEAQPDVEFTLVASPNLSIDREDIVTLASKFFQVRSTNSSWTKLYCNYTSDDLCGVDETTRSPVTFIIVPSECVPELEGNIFELHEMFEELCGQNPSYKVPSVLQALSYWAVLHCDGKLKIDDTVEELTSVVHFDLLKKLMLDPGDITVPHTFVRRNGGKAFELATSFLNYKGRLAIG